MNSEEEDEDYLIEVECPICHFTRFSIVGLISIFCHPLPDIFRVKCEKCSFMAEAYEDRDIDWKIINKEPEPIKELTSRNKFLPLLLMLSTLFIWYIL